MKQELDTIKWLNEDNKLGDNMQETERSEASECEA